MVPRRSPYTINLLLRPSSVVLYALRFFSATEYLMSWPCRSTRIQYLLFPLSSWTSDTSLVISRLRSALPLYHFNLFFCILHEVQPYELNIRREYSSLIIYKWSHCTIWELSASPRRSEVSQCTNSHMIVACLTHVGDNSRYGVLVT